MSKSPVDNTLLVPKNFIHAVREAGYLSLAHALRELIDNSLEAAASRIYITMVRDVETGRPTVTVEDDGVGMSVAELASCLRFGGSSRFNSRDSFGRFGMGLPSASLSQSSRVEVTTWRRSTKALTIALDVEAVERGDALLGPPTNGERGTFDSGCRVVWRNCDRIEYQRLGWLERSLHRDLGRTYRRFLLNGLDLRVNGAPVVAVDPMMLNTTLQGASAEPAFAPMRYEIATKTGRTAYVTVSFSQLPVAHWHDIDNATKRRAGIVGNKGVSILRAGREIAEGWYFMGEKRRENYDDWWRCEIDFDPALDEEFGITVNKQGIRPSVTLKQSLEPQLEAIARMLNARVRRSFEAIKFEEEVRESCRLADAADPHLPLLPAGGNGAGALRYRLHVRPIPGESLFEVTLRERILEVVMNADHPALDALYRPLQDMGDAGTELRIAFELLVLSLARSLAVTKGSSGTETKILASWGTIYGRMLQQL
jgi:hypothetical protein